MKVVKAITLRVPAASRIAAGEGTIAYTGFRTGYRGEILIVADQEPWYGVALAEMVDVRGISPEMSAPISRGYAWTSRTSSDHPLSRPASLGPLHGRDTGGCASQRAADGCGRHGGAAAAAAHDRVKVAVAASCGWPERVCARRRAVCESWSRRDRSMTISRAR